jgi:hypothetical protein
MMTLAFNQNLRHDLLAASEYTPVWGIGRLPIVSQWRYKDFKPKNPISVTYGFTQFPRLVAEVPPFVVKLRKVIGKAGDQQAKLGLVREIPLATYGKEPESAWAEAFASRQLWHAPRQGFSLSDLTDGQNAVPREFDARIADAE